MLLESLYNDLSEELNADLVVQRKAGIFYKRLLRFLNTFEAHRAWHTEKGPRGELWLVLPAIAVDKRLVDLEVAFAPLSRREYSSTHKGGVTRIILSVLPADVDTKNLQQVEIRHHKDAVVHEFSHYLYRKAHPGDRSGGDGTYDEMLAGKWGQYFNTPQEFNSFYHQGLSRLLSAFRAALGAGPGHVREVLRDGFEGFYATALRRNYWRRDFLSGLNRQYTQKMKSRLKGVYSHLVGQATKAMGSRWQ
jgi:hypothetical protein